MIYVGMDDTDTLDTRGTNQLAKAMARAIAPEYLCHRILRHQLLEDPRVPCTSKNGAASLVFEYRSTGRVEPPLRDLANTLRQMMLRDFVYGSDPGLCVATEVDVEVVNFARRCQRELVGQPQARDLAARHGLFLEGLGGTNDGVIGALAAVGLAAANDDGRVVQWEHWPDNLSGRQPLRAIRQRGIEVREVTSSDPVGAGYVDVGKHLRPNWRAGRCVLFVVRDDGQQHPLTHWTALKIP